MNKHSKILLIIILAIIMGGIIYYISPPDWPASGEYIANIYIRENKVGELHFTISDKSLEQNFTINNMVVNVVLKSPGRIAVGEPLVFEITCYEDNKPVKIEIKDVKIEIITPDTNKYTFFPNSKEHYTIIASIQPYIHAKEAGFVFGSAIVLFAAASIIHYIITGLYVTISLVLIGIQPMKTAYQYYMAPLIMVFIAGSAMELVIRERGLDVRVARLLSRIGRGPFTLILGVSFLGSFLSMWMSNTAATYVMLPLVAALLAGIREKAEKYSSIVMVSLAMGASIGGTATLIGTPPNLIAAEFLNKFAYGYEAIGFYKWILIGLPAWFIGFSIGIVLAVIYAKVVAKDELSIVAEELKKMRKMEGKPWSKIEVIALIELLILVALWITEPIHGIKTGIAAGIGILLFFATGILNPKEHWKKLAWDLMVLFGAGLTLGSGLMKSGWANYLLSQLHGIESLGWAAFFIIGFTAYIIGTFISSHTSASAFVAPLTIPLGMTIAAGLGLSPATGAALATVVAVVSLNNAIALPISTPPSAIVYASGKARIKDLIIYGFLFGIIANAVIIALLVKYWAMIL